MIDVNDLRKGVTFQHDNQLWKVLEYAHHKPGRGTATIRTKVRNLRTGAIVEKTFISGDRVQDVRLDHTMVQYLYHDDDFYYFMDTQTYDQFTLPAKLLTDVAPYLKDGLEVKLTSYQSQPLDVEMPITVDLEVVEAEAAVRGDTATGAQKLVTTEAGARIQVPLFVNVGDRIRVDTRDGKYLTRV